MHKKLVSRNVDMIVIMLVILGTPVASTMF